MKSSFFFRFASIACALLLVGCNVFDSDTEVAALDFEKMHVYYEKYGGWINTSTLEIRPSGEAIAKEFAHGSGEVLQKNTSTLSEQQKDRLVRSFALFQSFDRHYKPEKHYTDQNFYSLRLTYDERTDTVTVYDPANASLPEELERLIADVENLHQIVLDEASKNQM
jgi:hypothetical protein